MVVIRSVVVDDFDFKGIPIFELEAKPPLIVDTNAVLPYSIALKCFQSVVRRHL